MLRRLAAAFLSLSLLASAADARSFARPPTPTEVTPAAEREERFPVRLSVSRAEVMKALAARRAKNLAAFRAYRKAGVYPHNTIRSGPLNVWLDEDGHLCAAATMIAADGRRDLVDQVAASNTNLRLLDVTDGPVLDWLLTSGFTLEEIDRIQAPMVMPPPIERTPEWRMAEDARLRRGYVATEAWLVKHRKAGLAMAAERLMERPELARALVDAS